MGVLKGQEGVGGPLRWLGEVAEGRLVAAGEGISRRGIFRVEDCFLLTFFTGGKACDKRRFCGAEKKARRRGCGVGSMNLTIAYQEN